MTRADQAPTPPGRAVKWTRRGLITAGVVAGGALVVGVAVRPGHRAPRVSPLVADDDETLVNVWLKIADDNRVTVIVPHAEMGQGVQTSLAQMLADELDADWDLVDVMEAPAHEEYANYAIAKGFLFADVDVPRALVGTVDGALLKLMQAIDLQLTGASISVRGTGEQAMRVAGAAARQMLRDAAAERWEVSPGSLVLARSTIRHEPSGRTAPYAEFAAAAARHAPPAKPVLKTPDRYTLMGRPLPRFDIPAKVDGSAQFGIDAVLPDGAPDLLVATVRRSPVFGGALAAVDGAPAMAIPGVREVVRLDDAVAVVAHGYWSARQGLDALAPEWDDGGRGEVDQKAIFAQFGRDLDRAAAEGGEVDLVLGDADAALADASNVIEAEYRVPYLAHAAMEPLNCTVWAHDGTCDVWTGSQNPLGVRAAVAEALDIDDADVTVHNMLLGGGFGRRASPDFAVQAAKIAGAVGAPVKLIWSREEDTRQDQYRPASISRFRGALDDSGRPVAWLNRFVDKHEPAEAPHVPYAIANQRIEYVDSPTHVPFGPWRSVDHSQHGFFTESFIDELAIAAGADPYEYRRSLLDGAPRHLAVLDAAAERAGWGGPVPEHGGRGIALQQSFGTIVAQVVDVTVRRGNVRVERVVCVVDPGFAINPDGLVAQMESGIAYGLTAALYGDIAIERGRVSQGNFHDYPMLRMDEAPAIDTLVINGGGIIGGAGEPGTPAIAPALANAVYQATGTRVRELPVSKYDFTFTIEERDEVA